MSQIWTKRGEAWKPVELAGFSDEKSLHNLIEEAPHMLPLSGQPELVIVGREVQLSNLRADLLAVERASGRVVVIEIKLNQNSEARRAVIGQVLSYAALLHRKTLADFEAVVAPYLGAKKLSSIVEAVASTDQSGGFNEGEFTQSLTDNLRDGGFRLVVVLDSAPSELVRIAGYFEAVGTKVILDVLTVSAYKIGETTVLAPERVDPLRLDEHSKKQIKAEAANAGALSDGTEAFEAAVSKASAADQEKAARLLAWARGVESEGLVKLQTYSGLGPRWSLLPRFYRDNAGLITIYYDKKVYVQFWRSVFERRAPALISKVEQLIGKPITQGGTADSFDDELLSALTEAYRVGRSAE